MEALQRENEPRPGGWRLRMIARCCCGRKSGGMWCRKRAKGGTRRGTRLHARTLTQQHMCTPPLRLLSFQVEIEFSDSEKPRQKHRRWSRTQAAQAVPLPWLRLRLQQAPARCCQLGCLSPAICAYNSEYYSPEHDFHCFGRHDPKRITGKLTCGL